MASSVADSEQPRFTVSVKCLSGREFSLRCSAVDTVAACKAQIAAIEPNFGVFKQRLLKEGIEGALADSASLASLEIQADAELILFIEAQPFMPLQTISKFADREFVRPMGICVDRPRDCIYVTDYGANQVLALDETTSTLRIRC